MVLKNHSHEYQIWRQAHSKYIMAYVDPRDLSVDLLTQANTSSTTIPVKAVFNKLINISSVSLDDFVITGEVTPTNLDCTNSTDADNALRTVCSIDLEVDDIKNPATITVDFPAGKAQDKTRGTPKITSLPLKNH